MAALTLLLGFCLGVLAWIHVVASVAPEACNKKFLGIYLCAGPREGCK